MVRKIIHFDLDAFYCAVEEQFDPKLKGKPFAVGGRPDQHGVVASCSYAARQYGVRSAMPMAQALRLCPQLQIIGWRRNTYGERSKEVMEILHELTSTIEQLSIDEAYLDITKIEGFATTAARNLQKRVQLETGLPCSLGVATNKLVAKIATDVGKASKKTNTYPNAIQVVPPGKEREFLAPLPVEMLWGVGPKTAERLSVFGIHTIGDLANWPAKELMRHFGQNGAELALRARGIDDQPVVTYRETKSISQEITFSEDVSDENALITEIKKQCASVSRSLKHKNLLGATVKIKLRWPDFSTITRQSTLKVPTDLAIQIENSALNLFRANWKKGMPVRLLGVGISNLQPPSRQLSLWDSPNIQKQERLEEALKELNQRFGREVVHRGEDLED